MTDRVPDIRFKVLLSSIDVRIAAGRSYSCIARIAAYWIMTIDQKGIAVCLIEHARSVGCNVHWQARLFPFLK